MQRIKVNPTSCVPADLLGAVQWLQAGKIVAYPTDTLYGLAVDPASDLAVRTLFQLKGRQATAALPLIAASRAQVEAWCGLSAGARRLADEFWPGPLSLIGDAPGTVVPAVHAGRRSVAIRVPANSVARALAAAWGSPVTATSANRSGGRPAQFVADLEDVADDRVLVIDGGDTAGGPPSTIVDARTMPAQLVREGAISWERVLNSLQER
jgi:L-threonylcarbamoyladenylate synthase